jgi:peptidoglycan/LPS O-acetylase OafA/YrhL
MNKSLSLYLDLLRFIAAIAVFLDHISSYPFTNGLVPEVLGRYGSVAVSIFFVLSGYVIAHVVSSREKTVIEYSTSRIARLYSVLTVSLLLTFLMDSAGAHFNPELYQLKKVMWKPESITGYASSLFFVNEYQIFKFNGISPGSNGPIWSLSFEATYYLIAGLLIFGSQRISIFACTLILLTAGKTMIALAPLWALGYYTYKYKDKLILPKISAYILYLTTIYLLLFSPFIKGVEIGISLPWGRGPFNREIIKDYIAAIAIAGNLVAAKQLLVKDNLNILRLELPIRWMGSLTFPLYCLHYPMLAFFTSITLWPTNSWSHITFLTTTVFVCIIILTPVCDSFKLLIKEKTSNLLHSLLPPKVT